MDKIELNDKEKKVLAKFPKNGEPVTIAELAKAAFPSMGVKASTRGNSWVRNSLRKPIRAKMVKQVGRGLYAMNPARSTASRKATRKASAAKISRPTTPP